MSSFASEMINSWLLYIKIYIKPKISGIKILLNFQENVKSKWETQCHRPLEKGNGDKEMQIRKLVCSVNLEVLFTRVLMSFENKET